MIDVLAVVAHVQTAGDGWTARCPAHEDRRNSLSIGRGADDRWLLKCHAGCTLDAILSALHLERADLFPTHECARAIVAVYPYRDEHGLLLYEVVRYLPKDFRQRAADGSWSVKGIQKVVYRLPELRGRRTVFVTEGEADANRLWDLSVPATTNASGAGKWLDEYAQQLHAAGVQNVVVVPDNDPPGETHGRQVARSCHDAGLIVKLIPLPGLPPKGDVSDFLAKHSTAELLAIVKDAPRFHPATLVARVPVLTLTSLGDLLDEPDERVDWVVDERIPAGGIVLLAAPPKAGKSTLARELALCVAIGRPFLGWPTTPGRVWYLSFQDKRKELKRHFRRLGAPGDAALELFIDQAPADLLPRLHARAAEERPILIVIDMLAHALQLKDFNDYGQTTRAFAPLLELSRATGAALLPLHHGSAHAEREGLDAVLNSTAISGSVDNVLLLKRTGPQRTIASIQRIGPDLDPTILVMNVDTGRLELAGSKREYDDAELQRRMVALLKASAAPLPEAAIQAGVEGRKKDQVRILRFLLGSKQIERSGRGIKGAPFVYRWVENAGSHQWGELSDANQGLFTGDLENGFAGSGLYKEKNQNSQYVDPSQDLRSSPDSRPAESLLAPTSSDISETDPSEDTVSTDKHWSDSGSQNPQTEAHAAEPAKTGPVSAVTAEKWAASDRRFRDGFKKP